MVLFCLAAPSPYSFAADAEAHALEEDLSPDMDEQEQVARVLGALSEVSEEADEEEVARALEDALQDEAAPGDFEEARQLENSPFEFNEDEVRELADELADEFVQEEMARSLDEEASQNFLQEEEDDFFE